MTLFPVEVLITAFRAIIGDLGTAVNVKVVCERFGETPGGDLLSSTLELDFDLTGETVLSGDLTWF